jgi:disulfide bond formation protein DsbB
MHLPTTRQAGALSILATGAALLVALGSEWFLGLVPCALCLWERWPYRMGILLAILAALLPTEPALAMLGAVMVVMLGAAGLGFVHVGVERGFWPSPLPECAAPHLGSGSIAERLAAMPATPSKPCDDPTYLIPGLPVSMATMNTLYALAIAVLLAIYLWRSWTAMNERGLQ